MGLFFITKVGENLIYTVDFVIGFKYNTVCLDLERIVKKKENCSVMT